MLVLSFSPDPRPHNASRASNTELEYYRALELQLFELFETVEIHNLIYMCLNNTFICFGIPQF